MKDMNIEEKLERMERITRSLKDETTPLEEALSLFEEGISIGREVEKSLNEAERKVEIILNGDTDEGELHTGEFESAEPFELS